jgi:hypothetical protein
MMTHDCIVGSDPNGVRRIYASNWIKARQEARKYIRKHADAAPLSAWCFELHVDGPKGTMSVGSDDLPTVAP